MNPAIVIQRAPSYLSVKPAWKDRDISSCNRPQHVVPSVRGQLGSPGLYPARRIRGDIWHVVTESVQPADSARIAKADISR